MQSFIINSQAFNPLNINLNHFISITMFFFFRKRNLPFFPGEKSHPQSQKTHRFPHIFPPRRRMLTWTWLRDGHCNRIHLGCGAANPSMPRFFLEANRSAVKLVVGRGKWTVKQWNLMNIKGRLIFFLGVGGLKLSRKWVSNAYEIERLLVELMMWMNSSPWLPVLGWINKCGFGNCTMLAPADASRVNRSKELIHREATNPIPSVSALPQGIPSPNVRGWARGLQSPPKKRKVI